MFACGGDAQHCTSMIVSEPVFACGGDAQHCMSMIVSEPVFACGGDAQHCMSMIVCFRARVCMWWRCTALYVHDCLFQSLCLHVVEMHSIVCP